MMETPQSFTSLMTTRHFAQPWPVGCALPAIKSRFMNSGERLLETPRHGELGCILLDLRMDGIDGLDLQNRLAKLGYTLPIVFLTGHGDVPASVRAVAVSASRNSP